jgi:hypothetical protein
MSSFERRNVAIGVLGCSLAAAAFFTPVAAIAAKSVCLPAYQIDHTQVLHDSSILFYMRNHKVWKNTPINNCSTLSVSSQGFSYEPTSPGSDEICSNLVTIHVNDTHETCMLGEFVPYTPPQKAVQAQ